MKFLLLQPCLHEFLRAEGAIEVGVALPSRGAQDGQLITVVAILPHQAPPKQIKPRLEALRRPPVVRPAVKRFAGPEGLPTVPLLVKGKVGEIAKRVAALRRQSGVIPVAVAPLSALARRAKAYVRQEVRGPPFARERPTKAGSASAGPLPVFERPVIDLADGVP